MSTADFNSGRQVANFHNRRELADADSAIDEWKAFSDKLKEKLAAAEKKAVVTAAREAGRDAQQLALREALSNVDPNHPLLKELKNIKGQAMAASFSRDGYSYDVARETLRKL